MAAELNKWEVRLTHSPYFHSISPSLPVLLHRLQLPDCSDSRWFSSAALRAAGIRRHLWVSGPLIACAVASLPTSTLLYPRMLCCQSSGIWLISCSWLPVWTFQSLSSCSSTAHHVWVAGRKVTSVYLSVAEFARVACCWLTAPVLNIGQACFVCACSSRSASDSENANDASHQRQSWHVRCPCWQIYLSPDQLSYESKVHFIRCPPPNHHLPQSNLWPLWYPTCDPSVVCSTLTCINLFLLSLLDHIHSMYIGVIDLNSGNMAFK